MHKNKAIHGTVYIIAHHGSEMNQRTKQPSHLEATKQTTRQEPPTYPIDGHVQQLRRIKRPPRLVLVVAGAVLLRRRLAIPSPQKHVCVVVLSRPAGQSPHLPQAFDECQQQQARRQDDQKRAQDLLALRLFVGQVNLSLLLLFERHGESIGTGPGTRTTLCQVAGGALAGWLVD